MSNIVVAFLIGLSGSIHCVGMCGGIAGALCIGGKGRVMPFYHLGRIITYSLLGLAAGLLGHLVAQSAKLITLQRSLSLLAGLVMVYFGLQLGGWLKERWGPLSSVRLPGKLLRQAAEGKSFYAPLLVGLFNGLLPCGMVYAALALALSEASPAGSTAVMAAFGLGTLPAFTLFTSLLQRLSPRAKGKWLKAAALLLIIFGLFTALRGSLNIHDHDPAGHAPESSGMTHMEDAHQGH
ncbi:MAG: sulfite exporter TauE/SafE family protein [Proteobacteria bacterium]|nr:sulfite exporter TauE/SafE family protein [Pseudomonadota bacterium]